MENVEKELAELRNEYMRVKQENAKMRDFIENKDKQNKDVSEEVKRLEPELAKVTSERDQLVGQLKKSQEMLLNLQQDLQQSESELEQARKASENLKQDQGSKGKEMEELKANLKKLIDQRDQEIQRLTADLKTKEKDLVSLSQAAKQERAQFEQLRHEAEELKRCLQGGDMQAAKMQELAMQEKARADKAETLAGNMQVELAEMQQQFAQYDKEMQQLLQKDAASSSVHHEELHKTLRELDHARAEIQRQAVEKDRLEAQLHTLVAELEKQQHVRVYILINIRVE
ncbi:unnamed protein product [Notodromas monacha]|uniref:Uncharacterized protein n=1 Tax=Notodromas monacha TaxID=399045 RepID=A0A7R9GIN7_9CRUS|nr:unnamed protein product [Notodromas monacha]CAG0922776.1 unnamed protein product [Notodromas monacha]